ncbi:hypothetical protein HPB49_017596 [Dermacentor silvarum]|uniref:Uncharacterized protein n=1 Tax=Dermacentor silvarum TaxID=543639 RepID=A0ACB8DJV1_DERSI|nr:hypothetical protein HPB49_017596 [Dermacentor silvarum]
MLYDRLHKKHLRPIRGKGNPWCIAFTTLQHRRKVNATTTTHLESAALLLRTQIAVGDPSKDKPCYAEVRSLVATAYWTREREFTVDEIEVILGKMLGNSAPGADGLTPASAVLALFDMKTRLLQLKAEKTPAVLMSLDFRGAFDSVWHPLVLRFFRDRGLPSNLYHLIKSFLEERHVIFRSHAGEVAASQSLGSPQGSPLSPLLWNVLIHDRLCLPMPPGATVQAYADDTVILVAARSRDELGAVGSEVLARVVEWTEKARVSLNMDKTFCVLFSHGRGGMERVHPTIRLGSEGKGLKFVESLRILGVIFDRRLSFFKHADHLEEKAEFLSAKAIAFAQMQGGLRPKDHSPIPAGHVACLDVRINHMVERKARLPVLMRAPPLALELDRANAEFRLFALGESVHYGASSFSPCDVLFSVDPWDTHPADARSFAFRRLSIHEARQLSCDEGVHVYTDGSSTALSSGAAFVVLGPRGRIGSIGRFRRPRFYRVCRGARAHTGRRRQRGGTSVLGRPIAPVCAVQTEHHGR